MLNRTTVGDRRIPPAVGQTVLHRAPVGRHTLATGSPPFCPVRRSAELTAGEITVTNASGASPAAATVAIRRMIIFMYSILPDGTSFKRLVDF